LTEFPAGRLNLYMTDIGEPEDNRLRVVVMMTQLGESEDGPFGAPARQILADPASAFELTWDRYIAYAVRDECYAQLEEGEAPSESNLHVRQRSAFLDYVSKSTFATDEYPGPMQHWALYTLNHCLDVVSCAPPQIRRIEAKVE